MSSGKLDFRTITDLVRDIVQGRQEHPGA
jgi:hypothetical protein